MNTQAERNYSRIARAIDYIVAHHQENPSLETIAAAVHISPYHFQRLFTQWAGVSPKKFMQYLSLNHAKAALMDDQQSLLDVACDIGLSGTSRLHDLFITIEAMTPGQFRQGGAGLPICYGFAESPFGGMVIASTPRGICHVAFENNESQGLENLQAKFPNAVLQHGIDDLQQQVLQIFQKDFSALDRIALHLSGTPFQLKVWEALLKIPQGKLTTYGQIAEAIGQPTASRAVGTAIGRNPIAFPIPCHRVIRKSGELGGYMWGTKRKQSIIAWESIYSQRRQGSSLT